MVFHQSTLLSNIFPQYKLTISISNMLYYYINYYDYAGSDGV